jgi:hypothetical protein
MGVADVHPRGERGFSRELAIERGQRLRHEWNIGRDMKRKKMPNDTISEVRRCFLECYDLS